jgi:hypothetical protein
MKHFDRTFLAVVGVIFLGVGGFNLFFPVAGIAAFEIQIATASALNEVRANYGGMHFAMGLLFVSGALVGRLRVPALLVAALFTGGLVLGRSLSLALDGWPNPFLWAFFALEALGCVLGSVLVKRAWHST